MARFVQSRTEAQSLAGAESLPGILRWIAGARALITNDTMAAHLGVSTNRPTVIVANGVNYLRFTEYGRARITNVATVYPMVFMRWRKRSRERNYGYTQAVSADIASIRADTVYQAMEELIRDGESAAPQ